MRRQLDHPFGMDGVHVRTVPEGVQGMSALLVDAVVKKFAEDDHGRPVFDIAITDAFYKTRRQKAAKSWGEGRCLKIRVEPEEEAVRLDQYRHLWGHVFQPVVDTDCGYTKTELCLLAKAQFFPDDGRTSLTELNAAEMADFIRQCEVWLHTEYPDAFELHDRRPS